MGEPESRAELAWEEVDLHAFVYIYAGREQRYPKFDLFSSPQVADVQHPESTRCRFLLVYLTEKYQLIESWPA